MGLGSGSSLVIAVFVLCLSTRSVTSVGETTIAATSAQVHQTESPVVSDADNEVDIFDPSARDPLATDYEDNGFGFENLSDGEDPNSEFEILDGDLETAGTSNVRRKVPHPHGSGYPHTRQVPKRPAGQYPRSSYRSPYSILPGSYSKNSYAGPQYHGNGPYNRHSIYANYLNSKSYMNYAKQCLKSYGQTPRLTPKDLSSAFGYASNMIKSHAKYEAQMFSAGNYVNASQYSNAARHQVGVYSASPVAPQYAKEKEAMFNEYASKFLMHHYCLSKMQANYMLPTIKIGPSTGNPYADHSCYAAYGAKQQYCPDSKYRTIDGSCNNLYNPYWGKAKVCHVRFLPAAYEDGVSAPRVHGASGHPLPSPRVISTMAHAPRHERSYYTNIKVMWGQFLNHDILLTAVSVADYKGGAIKCCPSPSHPQCLPITIPADDHYQSRYKKTCIDFVRSAPCPLCTLGPREQQNMATSFIDLSLVYGTSHADMDRVRAYQSGFLKTGVNKCGQPILPPSPKPHGDQCSSPHQSIYCFDAGDPRVNQHPGLMLLHTLAVRAHNHHAKHLYRVNPKWNDERLFQEARRITIAQFQHITYHEYLPVLFGPTLLKYYDLEVNYGAGYTRYEPYTDPTTWNDYTIAARYGHSQVTSFYSLMGKGYNATGGGYWLRDSFFDPKHMHECGGDAVIQGLIHDPAMSVDPWVDGDVHNYLYRVRGEAVGSDLPAFNIQRTRDHALPSYHSYLEFCFGLKVRGWDDMAKFIPYEQLVIFRQLYKDWRDVELWPAVISERKFPDADIGPTAACIVGIQFYHLKYGDRYFYSHGYQTGSFTPRQLSNIKQVSTLASYLCLTGEYMPAVQKYAFFPPSGYNSPIPCNRFPQIDYSLWRDSY